VTTAERQMRKKARTEADTRRESKPFLLQIHVGGCCTRDVEVNQIATRVVEAVTQTKLRYGA